MTPRLWQINLGATAVEPGPPPRLATPKQPRRHLAQITGLELRTAEHLVAATSDMGVFMQLSGTLNRFAMKLSKICNDLRLLSSGPQFGLGEINLPPRQAGSSIMPGKVNPVIPDRLRNSSRARHNDRRVRRKSRPLRIHGSMENMRDRPGDRRR